MPAEKERMLKIEQSIKRRNLDGSHSVNTCRPRCWLDCVADDLIEIVTKFGMRSSYGPMNRTGAG